MKRAVTVILLLFLMIPCCRALDKPFAVSGLDELLQEAREYGVEEGETFEQGLSNLFSDLGRQARSYWRGSLRIGVQILAVVLLCGFAESVGGLKGTMTVTKMAGALGVTALSASNMDVMIGLGRETIEKMSAFSELLLPVMAALTAATGRAGTAAVRQGATMLFIQILLAVFERLLIPLVYAYLAACCAYAAVGNDGLKKVAGLLKGTVTTILMVILLAFVGYLTVSGTIAGSADAAAVKATKMAISRTIPVVGGILADTAESVLIGAGVLKNTVGVAGLLAVLAIYMGPFLQLSFHYMTYKVAAALTGTVAEPRLSGLLDNIGSAFGLVLGMTGACALLLLFSTVSAVSAVTP